MDTAKPLETDGDQALHGLLRERTAEIVMLTRELVRVQDALAVAQADLLRDRPEIATPIPAPIENDDQRARLDAAERHIQDLYKSTSWRVTAPLRALSRALRRR